MIKKLVVFLLALCPLAQATVRTVNSTQSTATIQAAISASVPGDTVQFTAGTYNITALLTMACGVTYTGPVVPINSNATYTPTAILDGTAVIGSTSPNNNGLFSFIGTTGAGPCTQTTTVQYLNFHHALTGIDVQTAYSNIVIQFNTFTDLPGGRAGDSDPLSVTQSAGITFHSGTTTSNTAEGLHTSTVDHNQFGDAASCVSPINIMISTSTACNGSCETDEGACNGMVIYTSIFGLQVTNNYFNHVAEGTHINCPNYAQQVNPCELGGAISQNIVIEFNDFNNIHRINWEQQPQQTTGEIFEFNTSHDWVTPYFGAYGQSMACCYNDSTAGPFMNSSNNVVIFNTGGHYGYGVEAMGHFAIYNNYLLQSTASNSATGMAWGCGNLASMSNNTVQGGWSGEYVIQEGSFPCGTVTQPTSYTGNITGPNVTGAFTSAAPTISPTPTGTYSAPITVTITDPGLTSGSLPQGNTSVYYTTDGSTPTVSSTLYTGSFTVSPGSTVNAIGMYGTGANTKTYPAGFGFIPSAVKGAHYVAGSGGSPVLTGVTLFLQGGGTSVPVSSSIQACGSLSYTTGIANTTICGAGSDAQGSTLSTWTSSNTADATITSTGSIAGIAAGTSNMGVKATQGSTSFASPAFALTVTSIAPVLNGLIVTCASTIQIGQTTNCVAICSYTGPQQLNCTTMDANGNTAGGWNSSIPAVATVSGNVVTGVGVGSSNIKATVGSFTSNLAPVQVTSNTPPAATLTGVSVACSPGSVVVGSTTQCSATCTYSDGTTTNCTTVDPHGSDASFTSSVTADATINAATGVLTGVTAGTTNVAATAGSFTAPAVAVPVTFPPGIGILGDGNFDTVGATTANYINGQYAVTGTNSLGYKVQACTFYLPTGTTYVAGSKWDCGLVLAPTATTQATSWLCVDTYITTGTTSDVGWHSVFPQNCGTLPASTAYWVDVDTNESSPAHPGEGFSTCAGAVCNGSAPTISIGTYPCYYISATYGVYTGMGTAMNRGCGPVGVQSSQYATVSTPSGTYVDAGVTPIGSASQLIVGGTLNFIATCQYSDGTSFQCYPTADIYGDVVTAWTSSNTAAMTIGNVGAVNAGVATGIAMGFSNIQATVTTSGGGTHLTRQWGITVNAAPPNNPPSSSKIFSR